MGQRDDAIIVNTIVQQALVSAEEVMSAKGIKFTLNSMAGTIKKSNPQVEAWGEVIDDA